MVFRVCEHVEDELDLPMAGLTDVIHLTDEEMLNDRNVMATLEEVVMGWERHIMKVIDNYLAKVKQYLTFRDVFQSGVLVVIFDILSINSCPPLLILTVCSLFHYNL